MTDKPDYFEKVHAIIAQIPYGKVTTYGAIAQFLGLKSGARMVGWACNAGTADPLNPLPFHRVVNRSGLLTGRHHFPGDVMRERLLDEGVVFVDDFQVDLERHFWSPDSDLKKD